MQKQRLTVIFIIAFLNLVGFGIIIPLLPFYAETFGADAAIIGLLIASYPAAQFISAPLLGRLSDRFGRRPVLLWTVVGNAFAFIAFGLAGSLTILFISRIFSGLMMGNGSVIQACVSDITEGKQRTASLGKIGAALGLGFIVGPAIGGVFSHFGFSMPAYVAALLSLINYVAIFFMLPETRDPLTTHSEATRVSLKRLIRVLRISEVRLLANTRFFFSLAFSTFTTIFALFAQQKLGLNADQTGYILAYAGVLIVIVQGFVVEKLITFFSEGWLVLSSMILMVISLLGWSFSNSVLLVLIVLLPLSLSSGVFRTVLTSMFTCVVEPDEVGGTLGLSLSIDSFTRIIAPGIGGYLIGKWGAGAPALLSAFLLMLVIPLTWKRYLKFNDTASR